MRHFIVITVGLYLVACVSLMYIFSVESLDKIKNTEANDIIYTIENCWPDVGYAISAMQEYNIDYIDYLYPHVNILFLSHLFLLLF